MALIAYGFHGRRIDEETGVYYFRHRFYDASQGRFLTRDKEGYVDGLNLYSALGNNPNTHYDPMGLQKFNVTKQAREKFIKDLAIYGFDFEWVKKTIFKLKFKLHPSGTSSSGSYLRGVITLPPDVFIHDSKFGGYRFKTMDEILSGSAVGMADEADAFAKMMHEIFHAYMATCLRKGTFG